MNIDMSNNVEESGVNDNGVFYLFKDGTMICKGIFPANGGTVIFPAVFADNNIIIVNSLYKDQLPVVTTRNNSMDVLPYPCGETSYIALGRYKYNN